MHAPVASDFRVNRPNMSHMLIMEGDRVEVEGGVSDN